VIGGRVGLARRVPLVVVALGLAACRERPRTSLTAALLGFADEASRTLALRLPASADAERQLRHLAGRARAAVALGGDPVDRLNHLVFDELGFRREVHDTSPELMLMPQVLVSRRGNCIGLSSLYLALGEALELPFEGVLVPGHLFVAYRRASDVRRVELLRRGEAMPRSWYVQKYHVPPQSPLYLRGLARDELLAVLRYNLANELRLRGRLREALVQYRAVIAVLGDHAEAHANLGLTHHLLEEHDAAERAYRRAALANPELPGLRRNLAELERDRRRKSRPAADGSR